MSTDPASPTPDPVEEAIFHAASDLNEPGIRAAFLDRACGADSALRSRIELLLAADLRARQFLAGDPLDLDAKTRPKPVITSLEQTAGDQIGRYKLLEKIGEGGMGVVYMAEQREPVVRKVALKIIKPGMDTRQVVARFEAERQALALMDHPNIARVLDGGVTESSRPYFVMDLVQGVPITQFCDERNLSTRARLDLFLKVCSAIQHAHQKGIIHRDIKPTNILVTLHGEPAAAGVPKVIDFGIAKATQERLTDKTLFTRFQHFIGTPAYMSPEQASLSGLDIDTRSDVYGLGVLLYELLTGKTPFEAQELLKAGFDEMRRLIREVEPVKPSTRLTQERLAMASPASSAKPAIGKDLDWIVMKCLEKDPDRRYETTNGLAADIQRHLSHEPITARPPSRLYELQKALHRHKVAFVAAAAVLLALAGGVAVSTWQAVRATRAEHNARAVKEFLIEELLAMNLHMGAVADPYRQQLLESVAQAAGSRFVNQPLMEAEVRIALGEAFFGAENTSPMLEQFEKALAIRRRLLPPEHSDTLLAMAFTAQTYDYHGRSGDAEKLLGEALALLPSQSRPRTQGEAEVLWTQGAHLTLAGRPEEGLAFMEQTMPAAKIHFLPNSYRFQNKLAWIIMANTDAGRTNEAEALVRAGIEQAEHYFGAEHPATAQFHRLRAILLFRMGRFPESAEASQQVLAIYQRTLGPNVKRTIDAEFSVAQSFQLAGEVHRAAQAYTNVAPRLARFLPGQPYRFQFHTMGVFFANQRDFEAAKAVFGPLRDSYDARPPEYPVDFDRLIDATAPTKGWAEVAKVYRTYPGWAERDAAFQRNMASAFLCGDDREGYRQTVTNALARALTATNLDEQRRFVEIVGLGRGEFASDEVNVCEKLLSLPGTNTVWHRPMAALLLRLGRFAGAIQRVDVALERKPSTTERARLLMLKAICLGQSKETGKARIACDEAEALMKDRLLARLPREEGFIDHDERTFLIHRREAQALLAGNTPD